MANLSTWSFNLPLFSIPAFYVLAIVPHGYASVLESKGDLQKIDNRNPHSSTRLDSIKRRLTKAELARWERAESCHRNHLENMPLMIAAIFAGLLAEARAGKGSVDVDSFAVGWLVVRSLYTVNYILTETARWSYFRSLMYFVGTFWAFYIIGKAAVVIGV